MDFDLGNPSVRRAEGNLVNDLQLDRFAAR
jgi:hypothetical protein